MSEVLELEEPAPKSPRQVLLGLFILFQLGFLVVSNVLGFVRSAPDTSPDKPAKLLNRVVPQFVDSEGHSWHWGEQLQTNTTRWCQLTGQDQDWSLFAPTVAKMTGFPCLLLIWDDIQRESPDIPGATFAYDPRSGHHFVLEKHAPRTALVLSDNEPTEMQAFFRFGKCKLRRYEGTVFVSPRPHDGETPEVTAGRVNASVRDLMNRYQEPALAYLKWRLKAWQKDHAEEPAPTQVILCQRSYRIHDPEEELGWDGPFLMPMLRWRPDADRPSGFRGPEPFDFTVQAFPR